MDCIDAQITEALMQRLAQCTAVNGYNTDVQHVRLARKNIVIDGYPYALVLPNESDPDSDNRFYRADTLPFLILYFDGENETDQPDDQGYIWRYRNVHADLIKCLMEDDTLGFLCQEIRIVNTGYDVLEFENGLNDECAYLYIEIQRAINPANPYKQA